MANGIFDFTLPDGRVIRVEGAPSQEAAYAFMDTQWPTLRRQTPIEGFGESFGQQFRGQFGSIPGAGQAAAAAVGAPETAEALGRVREFVAPGDRNLRTRAPELGDVIRNPIDALTAFAGQAAGAVVGGVAAPLAGAGIGFAVGGPGGAATGATAGLFGGAVLGSVDELYQGLVAEGIPTQQAGIIATTFGTAIGAGEAAALGPVIKRIMGNQISDAVVDRIASRLVGGRAGGVRQTAALGAGGEMLGETARQGVIAATTGELDLAERASRVGEAGIVGSIAGGGVGAGLRIAGRAGPAPGAPTAEPTIPEGAFAPTPAPTPAAEAAPTGPAPLTLPERPDPFTTREEAEAFVAEDPERRAPPISAAANPTAYVNLVNAARVGLWEQSTAETKTQAVDEFFPRAPGTQRVSTDAALGNIAEAAGRGELNPNSFSPNAVARAALASRDIDPDTVTPDQVRAASRQLDALAETGVIRRNVTETTSTEKGKKVKRRKTTYAVNFGTPATAQPAPTTAPTPEAAAPTTGPLPPATQGTAVPQAAPAQAAPPVAGEAIWQGPNADIPVRVLPEAPQQGSDGRLYQRVNYEGRDSYVPADQLRRTAPETVPQTTSAEWEARRNAAGNAALTPDERSLLLMEDMRDAGSPLPGVAQVREKRAAASRAWEAANPPPVAPAAPAQPTAAAAPDAEQFTFKTSKGSSYTGFGDGSTTRVKAARPEHPGDSGPKPRSTRTVYVTPDVARALAVPADTNWRFVVGDGTVSLITQRPDGRWGVSPSQRELPFQTQPAVGLNPIEFWRPETIDGREAYRSFHPGNSITELTRTAPAQPTARTTVEVNGVRRETTPETLQQTVDEMRAAPPTPKEEQLAKAAADLDPASGAGETTRTAEEALLNTPKNTPIQEQRKILDAQYRDVFAGGKTRKILASPLTGLSRQPEHQEVAGVGKEGVARKYRATADFAEMLDPLRTLSPESQARVALTLQESSARRQSWNRDAFTAEENAAMDGVVAAGQRGLDYLIDAYTRRYFDPNRAKTPAERTRLENFQRTKGERLITSFSDADLRAISDIGAREVRDLNRRRNPFYMPQVATGSHFVAAYERKPGGKKKLVRIYFYNPLNWRQRQRLRAGAQRDFEALSVQALREEFPDRNRFEIMERGIEATSDQEGQGLNLKRDGELIANYLDELKRVSGPEAQRVIDRLSKQIDKAKMDQFFKPNKDQLRAVTPWNAVDYARETLPNYYLALANIQARLAIQDDFARAQRGLNNEEKDYWNSWLNFNSTPVEALGAGRALAGAWFLGGNVSTALMQLTQNPVTLPARFARDGAGTVGSGIYIRTATNVYSTADTLKVLGGELEYSKNVAKSKRFSPDEVAVLKKAIEDGVVKPSTIVNIRGQFDADDFRSLGIADQSATGMASGLNKLLDLSFRFLSTVDETNRVIALLSGYRLAKARPEVMSRAGKLDNTTYATPYDYAVSVANETNFVGGPEDQPLIARFHPVAQVMTQFLSPSFKFLELFARSAAFVVNGLKTSDPTMAKAGAAMFGLMMGMQVMFAGLWSLPFADRLKELTEFVLSKAFDVEIDFEQEIEKLPIPSVLAAALNYGLPHALNIATLSERMKIDVLPQGSISEWDVFSVFGPVGGLVEKGVVAAEAYGKDDWMGVAYALLPTSLANVLKGAQIGITGEQWTRAGGRIITPEQVQAASEQAFVPPALRQAIGFAPPEFADIRRTVRRAQEMREPLQRDTEKANRELSLILLRMYEAQIEGRTADARTRAQEYLAREREINAEQAGKPEEFRVRINRRAIEDRARQDLLGRGSLDVLLRRAPVAQREEIRRMFERTMGTQE
jgi:hypothetical protein